MVPSGISLGDALRGASEIVSFNFTQTGTFLNVSRPNGHKLMFSVQFLQFFLALAFNQSSSP